MTENTTEHSTGEHPERQYSEEYGMQHSEGYGAASTENGIATSERDYKRQRFLHILMGSAGLPLALFLTVFFTVVITTIAAFFLFQDVGIAEADPETLQNELLGNPVILIGMLIAQSVCFLLVMFFAKWAVSGKSFLRLFYPSTYKGFCEKFGLPTSFDRKFFMDAFIGVILGLLLLATMFILTTLLSTWGLQTESSETSMRVAESGNLILLLLMVPIIAPLVEEMFFRGYLLGYLAYPGVRSERVSTMRKVLAVVISSVLFGLVHFQGFSGFGDLFVVLWTGTLGAVLALSYFWSGKITTAIFGHVSYNGATVALMLLML